MFGPPPGGFRPRRPKSTWDHVKSLWQDEFRWSLIKSAGLFVFGVYLARELKGVDLTNPNA